MTHILPVTHDDGGTSADEVASLIQWLQRHSVTYQINGGWAVDAIVGRQTRPHRDVDVFVDANCVQDLHDWLAQRGYAVVEDWYPVRVEWEAGQHRVDVHPMTILPNGDGLQKGLGGAEFLHRATDRTQGVIGGEAATVATVATLRELRQGYEPRPEDLHDLALLATLDTQNAPGLRCGS